MSVANSAAIGSWTYHAASVNPGGNLGASPPSKAVWALLNLDPDGSWNMFLLNLSGSMLIGGRGGSSK